MSTALFERLYADHDRYEALLCILDRQLHVAACQEVPDTENRQVFPQLEESLSPESLEEIMALLPEVPHEETADFQRLFHQIADERKGLELGHGRQAIYCPLCGAQPTDEAAR